MFDISLLTTWQLVFMGVGFGLIVGSFLNVFIYRFNTGRSVDGHSHCMSCGTFLKWYELFPVLSFLALRGRCRTCGCKIPYRYAVVESLTGLLFILSVFVAGSTVEMLYLWLIMAILVVVVVYDYNHYIIPDSLVIVLTLLTLGWVGYESWLLSDYAPFLIDVSAAVIGSGFFFILWAVSKGKWLGFGDVKLAFPLGLLVGAPYVFSMIVYSFWIGTVISLTIIGITRLQRGKLGLPFHSSSLTMKSVVPFAPFLVAGCLLVFFTKLNVVSIFSL